jgi:hypothetical protein
MVFAEHAEAPLAAGRSLKRGPLLFGPPGIGLLANFTILCSFGHSSRLSLSIHRLRYTRVVGLVMLGAEHVRRRRATQRAADRGQQAVCFGQMNVEKGQRKLSHWLCLVALRRTNIQLLWLANRPTQNAYVRFVGTHARCTTTAIHQRAATSPNGLVRGGSRNAVIAPASKNPRVHFHRPSFKDRRSLVCRIRMPVPFWQSRQHRTWPPASPSALEWSAATSRPAAWDFRHHRRLKPIFRRTSLGQLPVAVEHQ